MAKSYVAILSLTFLLGGPASAALPAWAEETAPPAQPGEDRDARWREALENIQAAIDEDPDEAARFIGTTPVQSLELEELEKLSDKAVQFTQLKEIERLQEQQAERRRIRDLQDLQNSRR